MPIRYTKNVARKLIDSTSTVPKGMKTYCQIGKYAPAPSFLPVNCTGDCIKA